MDAGALGNALAPVNATLNLTATLCLLAGFVFIRRRDIRRHRAAMLGAVGASALFLVFYVTRFALTGTHTFAGEGVARTVYLSVLFSHMVLAVVVLPLVLRLLFLAGRRRFKDHARLARWTFPIWLYVSVTGIAVYVLLYHVFGYR
jgi:putative membrane protein